jgi:hypothetical protein
VKTIVFQDTGDADPQKVQRIFAEAAIACNVNHANIVNTYAHELKQMPSTLRGELVDYKLYLIQVCTTCFQCEFDGIRLIYASRPCRTQAYVMAY